MVSIIRNRHHKICYMGSPYGKKAEKQSVEAGHCQTPMLRNYYVQRIKFVQHVAFISY